MTGQDFFSLTPVSSNRPLFSSFFIKFLRSIAFWKEPILWKSSIDFLLSHMQCNSVFLFFSNYPSSMNINSKFRLNNKQQIYILLFQTAYYLLKTDVYFTLQTFSEINSINSHIRVTDLEDISKELQNVHFSENINKIILPKPKSRTEKIVFVLKRTVEFLKLDQEDSIFKLTLLNSELKKSLTLKILKKILMKSDLIKKHRLHIWSRISTIKTICNYFIFFKDILFG